MEPKIRFKGFTGVWKETKFDTLAKIRRGLTYSPSNITAKGVRVLRSSNINEDTFVTSEDDVFVEETCVNIPLANDGDILITAANGSPRLVGKHAVIETNGSTMVPGGFMVLAMTDEPYFLNTCMSSPWYKTFLKTGVAGGNGAIGNLNKTALSDSVFFIPSNKADRDSLASYFQHLDSLIQSTTKKIESLKQVKAASLQSMFPQEGETTPRVRFKGFEGDWSKRNFADIFTYVKNNSFSRDQLNYIEGEVKNVHYGDVLIKFGDIIDSQIDMLPYVTGLKENAISQIAKLQDGDVIIADAAEDNTVGKCSEIINVGNSCILSGLHTIACRPIIHFALGYLGRYINSNLYHNQLLPLIQGSKISSISKHVIKQTEVMFPSYAEQQQIANYFTSLDSQITLQSQRLEKLKQIKSACLDNMFV